MNRIQKAAAATVALVITLVGSVLVTAPIALADPMPVASLAHSWHSAHTVRGVAAADSGSSVKG